MSGAGDEHSVGAELYVPISAHVREPVPRLVELQHCSRANWAAQAASAGGNPVPAPAQLALHALHAPSAVRSRQTQDRVDQFVASRPVGDASAAACPASRSGASAASTGTRQRHALQRRRFAPGHRPARSRGRRRSRVRYLVHSVRGACASKARPRRDHQRISDRCLRNHGFVRQRTESRLRAPHGLGSAGEDRRAAPRIRKFRADDSTRPRPAWRQPARDAKAVLASRLLTENCVALTFWLAPRPRFRKFRIG